MLTRPLTIVLTEKTAAALFGNEDPIGKTVIGLNGLEFEVTGIAAEAPRNSHIQYEALLSWATTVPQMGPLAFEWMNNWIAQAVTTYVLVKPDANVEALQAKFAKFMHDHLPTRVDVYQLYLQPFTDVYLDANTIRYHRMAKTGNRQYIYVFSIIAGFILFIACVNYINISTSKSARRGREVGMRKSLGATRLELMTQFLGESFFITVLSAVLVVMLLYVAIPFFNELAGKSLSLTLLLNPYVVLGALLLVVLVSIVSGLYPAFLLAAFRPAEVLKSSVSSKASGLPRHALMKFQFIISIVMIACTLLIYQQMKYVYSKDLGFDKEHVLVIPLTNEIMTQGKTFQEVIAQHPTVVSTSLGRMALGQGGSSTYIVPEGFRPDEIEIRMFPVDGNFQKTYSLEMALGRFFDLPALPNDSGALVINEALMRKLKWNDPLNKTIKFEEGGEAYPVIGVLKDFNFQSLYQPVEPLVMWIQPVNQRNLSIRFSGNPTELLALADMKWKQFESRYPFHYYFVDEAYAKEYQAEDNLYKTVVTFASISILIACLGLYGLVSFTLEQRTKEFGIRKVLGGSVSHLVVMVNKSFVGMVLLSGALAIPVILLLMNRWLAKFAFRAEMGVGVFALSIGITLLIAIMAVSLQAVKASYQNPVQALRQE